MDQVNLCMDIIEELQVVITSINDSRVKWAISGKAAVENIHKQLQTATEQLELTLGCIRCELIPTAIFCEHRSVF